MQIAIPLFHDVTYLDAVGPYEILRQIPEAQIVFVGAKRELIRTGNGDMGVMVDTTFDEVPTPEVVVVPGGFGTRALITEDTNPLVEWVMKSHLTSRFTTSVCSGALVLAKAGLLDGLTAATHWGAYDALENLGAKSTDSRVVEHLESRVITAAGVSSGIDMALRLTELLADRITAEAAQLMIEYDPQPPFDAGSVDKAGPRVMERLIEMRGS